MTGDEKLREPAGPEGGIRDPFLGPVGGAPFTTGRGRSRSRDGEAYDDLSS
jgi:hypothetical protein